MKYTTSKRVVEISTRGAGDLEIKFPTGSSQKDAEDMLNLDLCPLEDSRGDAWIRWARDIDERVEVSEKAHKGAWDIQTKGN